MISNKKIKQKGKKTSIIIKHKASIYRLTLDDLQEWLLLNRQKKFRAPQIWDWLYVKRVAEVSLT